LVILLLIGGLLGVGGVPRSFFGSGFDTAQLMLPEVLEHLDPVEERQELLAVNSVQPLTTRAPLADQANFLEHAQVLGHLRLTPFETVKNAVERKFTSGEYV
jgi:hypothetical protein